MQFHLNPAKSNKDYIGPDPIEGGIIADITTIIIAAFS